MGRTGGGAPGPASMSTAFCTHRRHMAYRDTSSGPTPPLTCSSLAASIMTKTIQHGMQVLIFLHGDVLGQTNSVSCHVQTGQNAAYLIGYKTCLSICQLEDGRVRRKL